MKLAVNYKTKLVYDENLERIICSCSGHVTVDGKQGIIPLDSYHTLRLFCEKCGGGRVCHGVPPFPHSLHSGVYSARGNTSLPWDWWRPRI